VFASLREPEQCRPVPERHWRCLIQPKIGSCSRRSILPNASTVRWKFNKPPARIVQKIDGTPKQGCSPKQLGNADSTLSTPDPGWAEPVEETIFHQTSVVKAQPGGLLENSAGMMALHL
jgi:hypothetical protein